MATFLRKTFTEILQSIQGDIDSRLPNSDSRLRRSILNVISYVVAGVTHGLYGFISWVALQVFPDTAETEFLNRWGTIWGVARIPASKSTGNITVTGTNGTVIPEGTELQRSDEVSFLTIAEATISGGQAIIEVEAEESGEDGNTDLEIILTFVSPIDGADSEAEVGADGLTGGANLEVDAAYLARLLDRIQQPPHGGNSNDYEQWALAVAGVTRAWVYPLQLGAGGVSVRFMMDDTYDDGIPESADVAVVQAYIDELRPVTADVTVVAPVAVPLNFTIHLISGDTSAIRVAVQANLEDLIRREAEPGGTLYLSRINEAISLATDEFDHTMAAPAANVTRTTGQITTMGDITWT
jgi:uncharacterized phage protein gp47/JayE